MSEHLTAGDVSNVPVFNCLVYVAQDEAGGVRARVANLAGIEQRGASEREVLGKAVAAFKQRITQLLQSNLEIPWVNPPAPQAVNEQVRLIAVHL